MEGGDYADAAYRQQVYDKHAEVIDLMVSGSEQHLAEHPDCEAQPLCIGGEQMLALATASHMDPNFSGFVVIVAVRELARARKREAALEQRLAVQRQLTSDTAKAMESADERETELRAEIEHLNGIIYDLSEGNQ